MNKILIFDNYDSFTYNLVHYVEAILNEKVEVFRNDQISLDEIDRFDTIILSPGPGLPDDAGILKQVIERYAPTKKILGVCLGMQAIGEVYGSKLKNLAEVHHGVATEMKLTKTDDPLFSEIGETFDAGRYHSWVIKNDTIANCLQTTCIDDKQEIMALKHKDYRVWGVQFHPESVLTPEGFKMIENFINKC